MRDHHPAREGTCRQHRQLLVWSPRRGAEEKSSRSAGPLSVMVAAWRPLSDNPSALFHFIRHSGKDVRWWWRAGHWLPELRTGGGHGQLWSG